MLARESKCTERPDHDPIQDLRLVQAASNGDAEAIDRIAARISRAARRQTAHCLADEREELVQGVLFALWSKLASFDGSKSLEAWTYGFVAVEHLKLRQRASSDRCIRPLQESDLTGRHQPRMAREDRAFVRESLRALKSTQQIIVRLIHFEEQRFSEVADELSLPRATVKSKYYRGLDRLRERLRSLWSRA